MYDRDLKQRLRKSKRFSLLFLILFLLFLIKILLFLCLDPGYYSIKIHGAIAFTATAPLLNLNLNYEKLRCKDRHN